jgi:hypothetical protein
VESVTGRDAHVRARLACIDDDAQGETLEVLWHDEVDASVVADSHLSVFENPGTDAVGSSLVRVARCGISFSTAIFACANDGN